MPRKKQKDILEIVGKFLHETGLDEELREKGADIIRHGINLLHDEVTASGPRLPPGGQEPQHSYQFTPRPGPTYAPPQPPPPDPNDPYVILNVPRDMATDEIEAVCRRRWHKIHPDHGGNEEEFKRQRNAWERIKKERGV